MDARIKSGHDEFVWMTTPFQLRPYRADDEDAAIAPEWVVHLHGSPFPLLACVSRSQGAVRARNVNQGGSSFDAEVADGEDRQVVVARGEQFAGAFEAVHDADDGSDFGLRSADQKPVD